MNPRSKNLALVGGAVLVVGFVGVNTLMPPAPPVTGAAEPSPLASSPGAEPAPAPSPSGIAAPPDPSRRAYAVAMQDLAGLPPDAAPGTRLELWVTWEPPLTEEPRLQKLIGDVLLERTIPGSVPEAPVSILLSIPAERASDLMYADAFGKLSVTLP